ncbi:MAG: hypothetical protein ACXQTW_07535 [Candidatus Methanospirareceae archaeon]
MGNEDLGICIEGIRRALVYLDGIEKYLERPKKAGKVWGRVSTRGLIRALKAIADHYPASPRVKERLYDIVKKAEESPWETAARYVVYPSVVKSLISDVLSDLARSLGFDPEKYEPYIPD